MSVDILKAINQRVSRRSYIPTILDDQVLTQIYGILNDIRINHNIRIELICNDGENFDNFKKSYGMFTNVDNYFVLIGHKADYDEMQKLGYFGEQVVLLCTALGLGTCWIGSDFDNSGQINLSENETVCATIAVGKVNDEKSKKEKLIHYFTHRKTKTIDQMIEKSDKQLPTYFIDGMKAVQKAPSALNRQPVLFSYENNIVSARVEMYAPMTAMDLGIAKLHFELASKLKGHWEFINGGSFIIDK